MASRIPSSPLEPQNYKTPCSAVVGSVVIVALTAIAIVTGIVTFLHLKYGFSLHALNVIGGMGSVGSLAMAGAGGAILLGFTIWSCINNRSSPPQEIVKKPVPAEVPQRIVSPTPAPTLSIPKEDDFRKINQETFSLRAKERSVLSRHPALQAYNRYPDVFSADEWLFRFDNEALTAEKLAAWDEKSEFPYINASCMGPKGDILTQGPNPHSRLNFWKMVWQSKSPLIVMATPFIEKGIIKCDEYFPKTIGSTLFFGSVSVTLKAVEDHKGLFLKRTFVIKNGQEERVVHHLHYDKCFDHKTFPLEDLFALIEEAFSLAKDQKLIGHCSAGIGRIGTFYACYLLYTYWKSSSQPLTTDIPALVKELRQYRPDLIQTPDQYATLFQFVNFLNTKATK